MSIAGKRAGLNSSRSNLFYEAIRIIKEIWEKTNGTKPRYTLWENVPGAFSSNKGEDFKKVLKEIFEIKGYQIDAPRPNRWQNAGLIMADNFSLAWRVFDAHSRYYAEDAYAAARDPMVFFKGGKPVDALVGVHPKQTLMEKIQAQLS